MPAATPTASPSSPSGKCVCIRSNRSTRLWNRLRRCLQRALPLYAELMTVLETAPWGGEAYDRQRPDGLSLFYPRFWAEIAK